MAVRLRRVAVLVLVLVATTSGCTLLSSPSGGNGSLVVYVLDSPPESAEVTDLNSTSIPDNDLILSTVDEVIEEAARSTPSGESAVVVSETVLLDEANVSRAETSLEGVSGSNVQHPDYPSGYYLEYRNETVVVRLDIYD